MHCIVVAVMRKTHLLCRDLQIVVPASLGDHPNPHAGRNILFNMYRCGLAIFQDRQTAVDVISCNAHHSPNNLDIPTPIMQGGRRATFCDHQSAAGATLACCFHQKRVSSLTSSPCRAAGLRRSRTTSRRRTRF